MLRVRNYFIFLFQKCWVNNNNNKNLSNHYKGSYCWLFNTSSLLKPTTSDDDPASHFTEEAEETRRELPLIITTKSTYLLGWIVYLCLLLYGALTYFKALLLHWPLPLASSALLRYDTLWVVSINMQYTNMYFLSSQKTLSWSQVYL